MTPRNCSYTIMSSEVHYQMHFPLLYYHRKTLPIIYNGSDLQHYKIID